MPENQNYKIILLRHAESVGNSNGLFQGHSDFKLSERGIQQAQHLAIRWTREGVNFDRVFSSPLLRARQTAEIIAEALGIEVEYYSGWMERDIGGFTGKPASEIVDFFPQSPYMQIGQSGESQWDLYVRASHAINELLRLAPGRFLIVAHGGIINLAMHAILGIPPSSGPSGPRFILSNAAFAELTYSPHEHSWRFYRLNDREHLSDLNKPYYGYAKPVDSLKHKTLARPSIRIATISDLDGILEAFAEVDEMHAIALPHIFRHSSHASSNRSFYSTLLSQENTRIFVSEINGEISGALYAYVEEATNYPLTNPRRYLTISILVVKANFRRMGIGLALMEKAHAWARQLGLRTVELKVWEFNEAARRFYESMGYTTANRKMWIDLEEGELDL